MAGMPGTYLARLYLITKVPIKECPNCHSEKIALYDRIIGYMTRLTNWSKGRQLEQKKRIYEKRKESYED